MHRECQLARLTEPQMVQMWYDVESRNRCPYYYHVCCTLFLIYTVLLVMYIINISCRFHRCLLVCFIVSIIFLVLHTSRSYIKHSKRDLIKNEATCKNFFGKQFIEKLYVCSPLDNRVQESIVCEKHPVSRMMAKCTIHGLVFEKRFMIKPSPKLRLDAVKVRQLSSDHLNCPSPSLSELYRSTEESDHTRYFVKKIMQRRPLQENECHMWLNDTTYVFGGDHHIYFRFLGWYNLFKTIHYDDQHNSSYSIIRFTEDTDFAEVEKSLFPRIIPISDIKDFPVCIRNATLVPRSFASTPFRCKMELLDFCSECLISDFHEPTFLEFRHAMFQACSITDHNTNRLNTKNMLVVLRKPYKRYGGDVTKIFERVLTNEAELLDSLHTNFPSFNVRPVYMEDLTLCEQINVSSSAQVFLGVHGAGMSHLWWTPKGATVVEVMPDYKSNKPSFEILSKLLKANYIKIQVVGEQKITLNIEEVIVTLKTAIAMP